MTTTEALREIIGIADQKATLLERDAAAYTVRNYLVDAAKCRREAESIRAALAAIDGEGRAGATAGD